MSAAPSPTADNGDIGSNRYPRPASSRRLEQHLCERDAKGERAIALAQAAIAVFVVVMHAFGFQRGMPDLLVLGTLGALVCTSAIRWRLAAQRPLPERQLDVLSVIDVAIVIAFIWSCQYAFGHPAAGVVGSPSFAILLLLVGVRALRLHPRPVVVAGVAAVAGWSLLVCCAVSVDGWNAIAGDYQEYLNSSFRIFLPGEAVRVAALVALVAVLGAGAYGARRILGHAAHMTDYGEALDSARKHLEESSRARARAESAIAALDTREAELSEQNRLFNAALTNMPQGLCMFDQDQKLLVCNNRYVEMYGLSKGLTRRGTPFAEIVESRIRAGLLDGQDAESYMEERLASVREKVRHTKVQEFGDGRMIAVTHEPLDGGGWVATHEDVTYLRSIEARLSYLARHDALTDLPNRVQLRERLDELIKGDALIRANIVVLVLEIDRFKELNDTFGPSIGDSLLQNVAQRLRRRLDSADTIARVGGDEFVVLQVAEDPAAAAELLAKRIHSVLAPSFDIDDHPIAISASIGVAVAPVDGVIPDDLLKNAILALEKAKREGGGNSRFFQRGMDEQVRARNKLEQDMRVGLREQQFELYYQPQLDLDTNEVVACEALLRWNHPEHGMISPGDFVALAEETGFIVQLGDWALRRACEEAATWPKHIRVAVNLSVAQFRSGRVRQSVIQALGSAGLSPNRLELEITESVLMDDVDDVAAVLHNLQEMGVGIALDDFGTGFSSLGYLTRMRFDKIKIDKHFIHELQGEASSALAVLRSVVALSKSLGLATLAEGIETADQLERVRAEGCSEAQGYLIGKPMPARSIAMLFAQHSTDARQA